MHNFHINSSNDLLIEVDTKICRESGAKHHSVIATRKNPAFYNVYVGHPISGIRVGRILEMQDLIQSSFNEHNKNTHQAVKCLFPMRTTHLVAEDVGANEYEGAEALFSDTRHFTLQNRMDAVMASDAVLVNFNLRDDDGNYRISKGIPFDYGWATAMEKPAVAVIGSDNPNMCDALNRMCLVNEDLSSAIEQLNSMLPHGIKGPRERVVAEIFDFTGADTALSMIASLAAADAKKHKDGGRAIIAVIPEGKKAACWHGQVGQVADWVLYDVRSAETVVRQLVA